MLQAIDDRDNHRNLDQRDMRPAQFFSGVSKRTHDFDSSRNQSSNRQRQLEHLNFKQYDEGEYIITAKEPPYANRHQFYEEHEPKEDAFDELARLAQEEQTDYGWKMREEHHHQAETPSDRLLRDFNVQRPPSVLDDHQDLRRDMQQAIHAMDEQRLSELIDVARELGGDFKWQDEL